MGYIGAREELSIMSTKRRTMSPEFKAKVALEAIRGLTTVNASRGEVSDSPESDHEVEEAGNGESRVTLRRRAGETEEG